MIVYLVFIVLTLLGIVLFDNEPDKTSGEKVFYWFLCLCLILISGLSRELGGDKQIYIDFFEDIDSFTSVGTYIMEQFEEKSFMPLWSIVNYYSSQWFHSFIPVQLLEALVINVGACLIAYKYTNRHFLFLLIFFISGIFFQLNTEVMREGFAIGFGLLALDAFLQKKKISYLLLGMIAVLFHISALILLLFPLLAKWQINFDIKLLGYCLLISFIIWLGSDILLTTIFPKLTFLPTSLLRKLAHYSNEGATIGGYIGLAARYIVIPFAVDYLVLNAQSDEQQAQIMQKYMIYQLILGTFICSTGWSFTRFANYSCIYYIIFITTFITLLWSQPKYILLKISCLIIITGFQAQRILCYYPENNAHFYDFFVPYTSVFDEKTPNVDRLDLYMEACPPKDNIAERNINE